MPTSPLMPFLLFVFEEGMLAQGALEKGALGRDEIRQRVRAALAAICRPFVVDAARHSRNAVTPLASAAR